MHQLSDFERDLLDECLENMGRAFASMRNRGAKFSEIRALAHDLSGAILQFSGEVLVDDAADVL